MSWITTKQCKDYLGIKDNNSDSFITDLISYCQEYILNYINQPLLTSTSQYIFEGNDSEYRVLKYFPIQSLTSLKFKTNQLSTLTDCDATKYSLITTEEGTKLYFDSKFLKNTFYQVTYVYGHTSVPVDVQGVLIEMVAIGFKNSNERIGLQSINQSVNGISATTQFKDEQPKWNKILNKYKYITI